MSKIDDSTSLKDISLPGLHDACARDLKLDAFGKCQDYSIPQLLNAGFRYIDLRLGMDEGDNTLYTCHSFLKCMDGEHFFDKTLTLDTVMQGFVDFLKENTTETLVVCVKYEYGNPSTADFANAFYSYLDANVDSSYLLRQDSIPTLGEARGKIFLCRRFYDALNLGASAGFYSNWDDQGNFDVCDIPYAYGANAIVQDRYKYNVNNKWEAFKQTADKTAELLNDGPVINFLSTNGSIKIGIPYLYAKELNRRFKEEYANKKIQGWVIVDFGDSDIAKIIYQSNW